MRITAGYPSLRLKFEFRWLLQRVRFPFIEAGEVPRILGARGLRFAQKWGDVDRLRSEAFDAQVAAAAAVAGGGGGGRLGKRKRSSDSSDSSEDSDSESGAASGAVPGAPPRATPRAGYKAVPVLDPVERLRSLLLAPA